jgi:hypothetical protein
MQRLALVCDPQPAVHHFLDSSIVLTVVLNLLVR